MKSAIVNGATGTIGVALVKLLIEKGITPWAICRPGSPRINDLPDEARVIECDLRNIASIQKQITERVDVFFHLAWMGTIGSNRNNAEMQTENIQGAIIAAKTVKKLGCEVFVGVGSQAEYGRIEGIVTSDTPCNPCNGYGIAKLCAGQMSRLVCNQLGIRHEWARVLSAYGPNDNPLSVIPTIIAKLLMREKPLLTKGEQKWDFCFSGDIAEALFCMAVSGKDGAVYPVGSGKIRRLSEYFQIIRDKIDPTLPLGIGELPYPDNQVMYLQADLTPLTNDTGFTPKTSFEEGIQITIDSYRDKLTSSHG